jgi:hypothetical protein
MLPVILYAEFLLFSSEDATAGGTVPLPPQDI